MNRKKKILKYFFKTVLLLLFINPLMSQEGRIKGLRIGYDLSRILLPYIDTTRSAFEVSADFEVKPYYYATAEYGQQQVNFTNEWYNYSSDGYYFRLGLDYNFLGKKIAVNQYEMVFGGFRYGYASYSHSASNIYVPDNYWGDVTLPALEPVTLFAHWFEITGGIRGELFKNCFIGWSFRARLMIYQHNDEVMYPYFVPGFGQGDRKSAIGFNYYILYRIPFYKVKAKE